MREILFVVGEASGDLHAGKVAEARTSKRSSTALATLLTFCPPGPELRTKRSSRSRSSIERVGVI